MPCFVSVAADISSQRNAIFSRYPFSLERPGEGVCQRYMNGGSQKQRSREEVRKERLRSFILDCSYAPKDSWQSQVLELVRTHLPRGCNAVERSFSGSVSHAEYDDPRVFEYTNHSVYSTLVSKEPLEEDVG